MAGDLQCHQNGGSDNISQKRCHQLPSLTLASTVCNNLLLHPTLTFFGKRLKEVAEVKLLGVILTETMDWGKHVSTVTKKASKSIGILQRARRYCDAGAIAVIYKAFVRSRIEYCSPLWIGAPGLDQLDRLQRRCCRIMGYRHTSTIPTLNIQTLEHRRLVSGACLYYRMYADIAPPDVCSLLSPLSDTRQTPRNSVYVPQRQVPRSNANYHQSSFVPFFTRIWNHLPAEIMKATSSKTPMQHFKKQVNKIDLEKLPVLKPITHSH